MKGEPEINDCELFASYAGEDLEKWKAIIGQQVSYERYGRGTVTRVYRTEYGDLRIAIRFDKTGEKIWDPKDGYGKFFTDCALPEGLAQILRERQIEDRRDFAKLKRKYHVEEFSDESPTSPLYKILIKIDTGEPPDEADKAFIRSNYLCQLLDTCYEQYGDAWYADNASACWEERRQLEQEAEAREDFAKRKEKYHVEEFSDESPTSPLYKILIKIDEGDVLNKKEKAFINDKHLCQLFDICYKKQGDEWYAVNASACWRDRGDPKGALKSTEGVSSDDPKCMAAILTTRGAALADLGELSEAERCAREAIEYQPDGYHPYNLLGRIYCMMDLPEEGAEYFEEARKRGAPAKEQEEFIKSTFHELAEAGKIDTRVEVARWLLEKDPKRYAWAKYYLDEKPKD